MTTQLFATGATVATPGALALGELLSETRSIMLTATVNPMPATGDLTGSGKAV